MTFLRCDAKMKCLYSDFFPDINVDNSQNLLRASVLFSLHRWLLLIYYLPLISNNPFLSPFPSKMSVLFEMLGIIEQQVRCLLTVRQLSVCAWGQSFVSFSCISRRARHLAARHSSHGASPHFFASKSTAADSIPTRHSHLP